MDHVGIDLGKRESQIAILTEDGELINRRIRTERPRLARRGRFKLFWTWKSAGTGKAVRLSPWSFERSSDGCPRPIPLGRAATTGELQKLGLEISQAAVSMSIAPIVGVPLLTAISGVSGWRAALAAGGLAAAGAAWFVAAALPPDGRRPTTPLQPRALLEAYAPLLQHPPTLRLLGATVLRAAWFLGLLTYLGAFLGEAVGLSTRQIGFVYTLAGGGYAAGTFVAGGRLGAVSPRASVAVSSVAAGLLVGPMLWFPNVWVVLPLLLLISLAAALCSVGRHGAARGRESGRCRHDDGPQRFAHQRGDGRGRGARWGPHRPRWLRRTGARAAALRVCVGGTGVVAGPNGERPAASLATLLHP